MKYYCHHSYTGIIDADTQADAQAQTCQLIRDNIEPSHIEVDEGGDEDETEEDEEQT